MTGNMWRNAADRTCRPTKLDAHQDAFGDVTHVLTHGAIADLTINVEGLIETHRHRGVLRGTNERFPPSLLLVFDGTDGSDPAMATLSASCVPSPTAACSGCTMR